MWLHLPTSHSSPDAPGSTWESPLLFQALGACCTSKGKLAQPASWRRAWKTGALSPLRFGPTSAQLTDFSFVAEWMESWAASHAQTYPLQASKPESTESIRDSGLNTSASFAKCNPDGSLLKTSPQLSLIPQEELYSEGLPKAGSMRNGYLFERPTWGHRIGENECSSWPSPRSEDSECCGNHPGATDSLTGATKQWKTPHGLAGKDCSGVGGEFAKQANQWATPRAEQGASHIKTQGGESVATQAEMWQTPATDSFRSRGGDRKDEMGLDQQARSANWPTPNVSDVKTAAGCTDEYRARHLSRMGPTGVKVSEASLNFPSSRPDPPTPKDGSDSSPTTPGSRRRLNPAFGCLLMAWPWWWTQTEPISFAQSAMAAYRSRLRRHLLNCLAGQGLTGGGR
jgi:hypothetical protein